MRVADYDGKRVILERAPRVRAAHQRQPPFTRPCPGPPQQRSFPSCLPRQPSRPPTAATTTTELPFLQEEVATLRLRLLTAVDDRRSAEARAEDTAAELTQAVKAGRRIAQQQRRELRALRDRVQFLEAQLYGTGPQ